MSRQDLLLDTVRHVRANGIGELSLRQLAEAIGSSHRMLLYHFGSREGLLAAVVGEIEAQERAATEHLVSTAEDPVDVHRASWARLRAPRRRAEERLFFELAAMAAQHRPGTEGFVESYIEPWLELADAAGADRVEMRLDIAVMRGLLLDLLVTGDRAGVDAAFELWLKRWPAPTGSSSSAAATSAQRLRSSS